MIADLLHGWAELELHYPAYREAEVYYEGHPDEVFANPKIAKLLSMSSDRYRFNFVKTPVNVLASRVQLSGITVPANEAATDTLTEVFDANDMDVHFPDTIQKAFEYGDSYLMVWPLDKEEDGPDTTGSVADIQLMAAGVEITLHDPKHTRLIYDEENERRKAYQIRRWALRRTGDEITWRVDLFYPDRIEQWISVKGADQKSEGGWTPYVGPDDEPEDWEIPHDFGEIPWFHFRTAVPYGVPVHEPGFGCQDAINKLLITELETVDSHGWPQRYALTDPAAELDSANDDPDWDDDSDTEVSTSNGEYRGGVSSGVRMGPGTLATLNGMKSVGQFPAADPSVFMTPAEQFVRFMAQITETPFHAFDPSGGTPSGESLKVAEAPLNKRAHRFATMFTSPFSEVALFVLKVRGVRATSVDVRWDAFESATGVDDWTVIAAKQSAGVPVDQTLIEAGYESEQVARWMDDQAEAMDIGHRVDLLGKIGAAVQSIGSGVALGVVSQEEASKIISLVLDQAGTVNADPA